MRIETILMTSVLLLVLCGISFGVLLALYRLLRLVHISVDWVTWVLGGLILVLCVIFCLSGLVPGIVPDWLSKGNSLTGVLAFFIAAYAASQWIARQWYVRMKQRTSKWLVQGARKVLLFLRKHHQFFGCIVAAGVVAHMVFFLPFLARISVYEEVTGFLAMGILALVVVLGAWLWFVSTVRKKNMSRVIHTIHAGLTVAFFAVLFLHM